MGEGRGQERENEIENEASLGNEQAAPLCAATEQQLSRGIDGTVGYKTRRLD